MDESLAFPNADTGLQFGRHDLELAKDFATRAKLWMVEPACFDEMADEHGNITPRGVIQMGIYEISKARFDVHCIGGTFRQEVRFSVQAYNIDGDAFDIGDYRSFYDALKGCAGHDYDTMMDNWEFPTAGNTTVFTEPEPEDYKGIPTAPLPPVLEHITTDELVRETINRLTHTNGAGFVSRHNLFLLSDLLKGELK